MNNHNEIQRRQAMSLQPGNHTTCAAAAEADRKVEILGNEVINPLEQRVTDLEDLNLEQRVDTLYQRLRPYEDYKELVDEQVGKLRQTEQALKTKKDELELGVKADVREQGAVLEELARKVELVQKKVDQRDAHEAKAAEQNATLAALAARLDDMEAHSAQSSSSSADANSLALDLLDRLQNGESLHPALARQMKFALDGRRRSTSSEDQDRNPLVLHGKAATAAGSTNAGVSKRRGRPIKHGRYSRKATADEIRKLIAEPERRESNDSASSTFSLSNTTSVDVSSAKSTTSGSAKTVEAAETADEMMAPARKREVPETQPKHGGDVEMDGMSDAESDEPPFIPGERKSGRTPKPRQFANQVNWKQANRVMRELKPGNASPEKGWY